MTDDHKLLTKQSYAKVMAIVSKHVWVKFHINQKDLLENRYSLYQDR